MTKVNSARHAGQDPSPTTTPLPSQSRSPELPGAEPIIPDLLTPEQWALVLDRRCRNAALHMALRVTGRGVGVDELLHCAQVALIEAARMYDPSRGVPFLTYARVQMRRAMYQRTGARQIPARLLSWRQDLMSLVLHSENAMHTCPARCSSCRAPRLHCS